MATLPTMEDVARRVQDLPSLPAVVGELLACVGQEGLDLQVLAGKIALDQSLSAKTLRLANSSFYGMPSRVTTIQQAVAVLGVHNIRTLVTACSVTGSFRGMAGSSFDLPAFWRHSVATAACARALARPLRQNPDTAFIAGLLHDLGTLVLATRYPDEYAMLEAHRVQQDCSQSEAERAIFGFDHAGIGGALAARWQFPLQIQRAVARHHNTEELEAPSLALAIHLANAVAHGLDLAGREDEQAPPVGWPAWQAAALSDQVCQEVFAESERTFHDLCQILVN
ncbi:HDOD domain-containing protein [Pseudoduganella aquatica]|uniref:HDOD domain-containing protein n=1 Tax=Pseudoduganella aquatica TaxID=2660641 RepID=A0A7X4HH38_9BURK|nr:HDOD domain-containing protein [Pseudoduganella aquatica]MYN11099.1 HDOD domain-containing protein [Pseudoduganella aquatica]